MPDWIDELADTIASSYPEWEAEGGMASQVEQNSDIGEHVLREHITRAIRNAIFRHRDDPHAITHRLYYEFDYGP